MEIRSVVVVAALGLASFAHGQQAVQWRVEDGGNGHWYRLQAAGFPLTWQDCRVIAESAGGYLATLTSQAEFELASTYASQNPSAWSPGLGYGPVLGGFQSLPNGGPLLDWQWVTGEAWSFSPWAQGEPNDHEACTAGGEERYLAFLTPAGWNDIQDTYNCYYGWLLPSLLIEWSADCNGDGMVDYGQILDGTFADVNANGVPDCCDAGDSCAPCPSDIDQNGRTDGIDLAIILGRWGTNPKDYPRADTNQDSTVDATDLSVVLAGWGKCP
jgi:hypothetical protein